MGFYALCLKHTVNSYPIIFKLVSLFGLFSVLYVGTAKLGKIIGIQCDETAKIKRKGCFATNTGCPKKMYTHFK